MSESKVLTTDVLYSLLPNNPLYRKYGHNIDETISPGIYIANGIAATGTVPPILGKDIFYGIWIVLPVRNDIVTQIVIGKSGKMALRTGNIGAWNDWVEPVYH